MVRYCFIILFCCGLLGSAIAHATDADSSFGYRLSKSEDKYFLHYPAHTGRQSVRLDSLISPGVPYERELFLHGAGSRINIRFVNEKVGFIYGYTMQYGFVNRVYRTADGGKTWAPASVTSTEKLKTLSSYNGVHLSEDFFHMADERRGFVADCFSSSMDLSNFYYFTTDDGGATWQRRKVTLQQKDYSIQLNSTRVNYNKDGSIVVILDTYYNNPVKRMKKSKPSPLEKRNIILRSTDIGKTFTIATLYK
jgi:hypothetical protein